MSYEPRGKVAQLISAMRAAPDRPVWDSAEVAKTMAVHVTSLTGYMDAPLRHKALFCKLENGRRAFSLEPFPADPPAAPAPITTTSDRPAWRAPVMTPPRGEQAQQTRSPLPAPHAAAPAPITVRAPSSSSAPEPDPEPNGDDEAADEEEAPQEFNAAIWLDGDLDLYGLIALEDGGYRITSDNVLKLRRRLAWGPM